MDELITAIHEIIKDYRIDEGIGISKDRIAEWIEQFDEEDREFILSELKIIFEKRYISKKKAKQMMRSVISFLAKKEGYESQKDFLLDCNFIDHQPEGKSQKVLIDFLNEILKNDFEISVEDCNTANAKFYIYIDDILCTGDTLFKAFGKPKKGWFYQQHQSGKTNLEIFLASKAQIVLGYFAIHTHGLEKVLQRLYFAAGKKGVNTFTACIKAYQIDNDFDRSKSKLEFLFPTESIKDESIIQCEAHIEEKIVNYCEAHEYDIPKKRFYRQENLPPEETLFSSPENRVLFEKIMLKKCIQLYNMAGRDTIRMRPLGYGLKLDMNFGFGALIFTWRNVPFNVPMIFWYGHRGWIPLFERKYVEYEEEE